MLLQNLRFAIRALRRSPLIAIVAITTLALGIGANTALFSVINAVLLRPLSYPHPERIVELLRHYPGLDVWATTATKFDFWRKHNQVFEAVAARSFVPIGLNLVGQGEPQRLTALATSSDYFRVLDVEPLLGRTYTEAEDKPGAGKFAVLSFALWQNLFRGNPHVLGKTVSLSDESYQVIGVMPRGFSSPQRTDLWVPMQLNVDPSDISNNYPVLARLKPGATLEMARAEMRVTAEQFRKAYGSEKIGEHESIEVVKYRDFLTADTRRPLWILLGAVALVLLIACANVANLLLVRSAGRQREMAVRIAIGASSRQLINQLLTESLLLFLAGAVAGCLIANAVLPLLLRLGPADIPRLADASIDLQVLLFALGVALLTGVAFGLFPALQSARLGIANPLRESSTRASTSKASKRVRQALVIAEIAITLLLLVGASLLVETFRNLQAVQPGFDPRHVLTMEMSLSDKYSNGPALGLLNTRLSDRLRTLPGVSSVATSALLPFTPFADLPFEIIGQPTSRNNMPDENYRFISPGYFSTLRIPVEQGREFTEHDTPDSAPVIVINQALARKYFPKRNPIGQQILVGRIIGPMFADKARRIVGVVGNLRDAGLGLPAPPELFEPEAQAPPAMAREVFGLLPLNWLIRTSGDPMAIAERVRREALTVAGNLPLAQPRPLEQILTDSLGQQRFLMTLLTAFAAMALVLGTVGLYGVISYSVAQRTRELGIRSALGAHRTHLLSLVIGEGMRLAGAGLALGLVSALALTRFLQSLLYGISASNALTLGGVTALMGGVAVAACFLPAYRASKVDPVIALHDQ